MKEFDGLFVSYEILSDTNLTTVEKLLLSVLKSDLFDETVSNQTLGEFFNLTKTTISRLVSSLEKKGYIETAIFYNYEVMVHDSTIKTTVRKIKVL